MWGKSPSEVHPYLPKYMRMEEAVEYTEIYQKPRRVYKQVKLFINGLLPFFNSTLRSMFLAEILELPGSKPNRLHINFFHVNVTTINKLNLNNVI